MARNLSPPPHDPLQYKNPAPDAAAHVSGDVHHFSEFTQGRFVADGAWPTLLPVTTATIADVFRLPAPTSLLPVDAEERKAVRITEGVLDYFPAALAEIAKCSVAGNVQHYGSADKLKWEQDKSPDHDECILRHHLERGTLDTDGIRHTVKRAWRALAALQMELQAEGAPLPRAAR